MSTNDDERQTVKGTWAGKDGEVRLDRHSDPARLYVGLYHPEYGDNTLWLLVAEADLLQAIASQQGVKITVERTVTITNTEVYET